MRFRPFFPGLLLLAAAALTVGATAHPALSAPLRRPDSATPTSTPADPLLNALKTRMRNALTREHIRATLRVEDDVLVAETHTHHARLHMSGKTGQEETFLRDIVVPDAAGWRLELRTAPGGYVGQAVRPQTLTITGRSRSGAAVRWAEYLGQTRVGAADKTVLVNLAYGEQVRPGLLERLKADVQRN